MDGTAAVRRVVAGPEHALAGNAAALSRELAWLGAAIAHRMRHPESPLLPDPPALDPEESSYGNLVERVSLDARERLILALALAPHLRPAALDPLFAIDERSGRGRTEFGGVTGRSHGGFLPTVETALALLCGDDLRARLEARELVARESKLCRAGLIDVTGFPDGEPSACAMLRIPEAATARLTTGRLPPPEFSADFPARLLTSRLRWRDLVLSPTTAGQLDELLAWARHADRLTQSLRQRLRGGYRALFYGPPGTGKTLTAALLGQRVERPVFRVALSAVVSKYVGETAKNLERLFARAEPLDCILFFDEADALFGKRAVVNDARDRYANQEVSYLLQRIEDYAGLVVLATNFESNVDAAFMRRFHAVVHFSLPEPEERRRLWRESLPRGVALASELDLDALAARHPLSGGAIINAVQFATLMAFERGCALRQDDLIAGIRRELQKDGRTL